jgi:uncharacterized protein YdeI (YjbR/CyaY-like superfamily)
MWRTGGTVRVPYAKKWQREADKLRKIALDCGLSEEMKWSKPCFTYQKKNVVIIIPLKDACTLSFFKGALLKDPQRILQRVGEHTQAGRWIKFTSREEIAAMQSTLRSYIHAAIEVEASGKKVTLKKAAEYAVPEELQARLDAAPKLRAAFAALTSGRAQHPSRPHRRRTLWPVGHRRLAAARQHCEPVRHVAQPRVDQRSIAVIEITTTDRAFRAIAETGDE